MLVELQLFEPFLQSDDRHLHQVRDAAASYLDIVSLGLQAGTMTYRTDGLTTIAAHHDAVLYLVLVLLDHLEEVVYAGPVMQVLAHVAG